MEGRKLIVKGERIFRLTSVVLEPPREGKRAAAQICRAVVYAPTALGPRAARPPRRVTGDLFELPALSRALWAAMEVGGWHKGGWTSRKDRKHRFLHLEGAGLEARWVLRSKDSSRGGTVFPMPRDHWNRISCGTLLDRKDLIVKDGRALRVVAVKVGKQSAALTYAPRGLQQLPKQRAVDAVLKK